MSARNWWIKSKLLLKKVDILKKSKKRCVKSAADAVHRLSLSFQISRARSTAICAISCSPTPVSYTHLLTSDVTISFDEAVSGCEKLITLQNPQTGKRQSLQVHIPAGIDTGKSIRLKGKGMPGTGSGEAGDLLLNITVTAKPGWERKEMDVYSTVRIPFTTAVFGGCLLYTS